MGITPFRCPYSSNLLIFLNPHTEHFSSSDIANCIRSTTSASTIPSIKSAYLCHFAHHDDQIDLASTSLRLKTPTNPMKSLVPFGICTRLRHYSLRPPSIHCPSRPLCNGCITHHHNPSSCTRIIVANDMRVPDTTLTYLVQHLVLQPSASRAAA